jgi:hypothetical protein
MWCVTTAERGSPEGQRTAGRFFAEPMREYALQCLGRPLLQAGCLAPQRPSCLLTVGYAT